MPDESASPGPMTFKKWVAVVGTTLGAFMAVLDIQITNSSLQDIAGGIGATADEAAWVSTAYLIGEIVTIALTPWFARVFSERNYLLVNLILFLLFSALCGFATNLGEMIAFRVGQGFTGGVFIPMALTVIVSTMPKNLVGIGQAMFGLTATLAPAVGPWLGGFITVRFGWEWNFFINFFPGVPMLFAILYAVKPEPMKLGELRGGDWGGIACMAIGLGSLITLLEEGQRKDWFGSTFICTVAVLAAIFIPIFIIIELTREKPFMNLRLLASRNLAFGCAISFGLGMGLYGCIYLVPLYLGNVQRYDPFQIGQTMIWVGLPQLLIFPLLPVFMKKFDTRALVIFGSVVFAVSCFMEAYMSIDYAHDQFFLSNVVRALGQPFTFVPVTALALGTLTPKQAGDGSAIFNIMRNLGGSVGIALLSTIVTRREQFHDFRIGENVTPYDLATQQRVAELTQSFMMNGSEMARATTQAYASIKQTMQREANIMAFNDAFYLLGWCLLATTLLVFFVQKPKPGATSVAA